MHPPAAFELTRRVPAGALAGVVRDIVGYRELAAGCFAQRETASLIVPLIISFGTPFEIALGRAPDARDAQPSFAAGLHAGPVLIRSDGAAACVQVNFRPLGAHRLFGGAMPQLADAMVDVEALFGTAGRRLRERLGASAGWDARFDAIETFIAARLREAEAREVGHAWRLLAQSGGTARIGAIAEGIGWSRKRLHARFRAVIGLGPKPVARMMRFQVACRAARGRHAGWADVAAIAGYADQAHLARDFAELAGETPTAWARRMGHLDPRLGFHD
ncbi:MAG TPA: helix-turn-helix domain-containing protein [Falsiroseomonas sp.]|jgi:AraC-like DNA-binding protein|nr:helix-turn-helix domain-containing protein [Falsiroseomonas sp.]